MSFDSRSLDRLRELGRSLPKRLPEPEPAVTPKARQVRHKVETEQDPDVLFRELMQVSPDGCLLYTSPSPRDRTRSRMPSSA